jgi:hypothetical protein
MKFAGAGFDEPQEEEPAGETAAVRSGERQELLGIGIALVAPEASAAGEEPLVNQTEVLELPRRRGRSDGAPARRGRGKRQ